MGDLKYVSFLAFDIALTNDSYLVCCDIFSKTTDCLSKESSRNTCTVESILHKPVHLYGLLNLHATGMFDYRSI